jgi:uncharacterized protein (TIGR02246 family)
VTNRRGGPARGPDGGDAPRLKRRAGMRCAAAAVGLLTCATTVPAWADADADKAAIVERLRRWTEAFNARDAKGTCDLFAPDLIATFRGAPDRGREAICAQIAKALADSGKRMRYEPDIREIEVSGDLAVVRLVWTLTVDAGSAARTSREPGIDVFRRQPDGRWSIARYLAFSDQPD